MAIGDQFSGLDMKNLIGSPLSAAADASLQLARSTAEFIENVGLDEDGKARTTSFKFNRKSYNEDGTANDEEMNVEVPLLAIVPIPNLQVDEVNILFDMEVKQSEKTESSKDYSGSFSARAKFWIVDVNVSGSVSSHESNTRSSDSSAKYHVDVSATNHGTPEGLSRVLDMMAANVAPSTVSSTLIDADGKPLEGERKARAEKVKAVRAEIMQAETEVNAAQKMADTKVETLKRLGTQQKNGYVITLGGLINAAADEEAKKQLLDQQAKLVQSWDAFRTQIKDLVLTASDSADTPKIGSLLPLYGCDGGTEFAYTDETKAAVQSLQADFDSSLTAQKGLTTQNEKAAQLNTEYQRLISGLPETSAPTRLPLQTV